MKISPYFHHSAAPAFVAACLAFAACSTPAAASDPNTADALAGNGDGVITEVSANFETSGADAAKPIDLGFALAETDGADVADTGPSTDNCPGAAGCACTTNADCDNSLCIETTVGNVCAKPCVTDCAAGFKCQNMSQGDVVAFCFPQWGFRCEPCSASAQCVSPTNGNDKCVHYGDKGNFCGSACVETSDCGTGFQCQDMPTTEGVNSKQCVKTDGKSNQLGTCACSPRAVKNALSTACGVSHIDLGVTCKGSRTCKVEEESGPTPCDAPEPATEICNNVDDDCDGKTDENVCDDANSCTLDACDPKGGGKDGCSHAANDNFVCNDGDLCTTGDVCAASVCNGIAVICDDKNPCTSEVCEAAKGCTETALSGPCDDGNACTLGDTCSGGQCKSGPPPSCSDGVLNGGETGKDCGGKGSCALPACPVCGAGLGCKDNTDCASLLCSNGVCTAAGCKDGVKNGDELDVDCGGSCAICPTLLLYAGGATSAGAERLKKGPWKVTPFAAQTVDGVSMAAFGSGGSTLGVVAMSRFTKLQDLSDNALQFSVWNQNGWQAPVSVGNGITTQSWPAVVRVGDAAQVVFHGQDFKYYATAFDGKGWSAVAGIGSPQAFGPSAPSLGRTITGAALAYFDGANANHVTARTLAAGVWGNAVDVAAAPDFSVPPTLVATLGSPSDLLLVYVKVGGQIAYQTWANGVWSAAQDLKNGLTASRVALANSLDTAATLAFRGLDDKLYTVNWGGANWGQIVQVGTPPAVTKTSPALAVGLNGDAELAWVDAAGVVWNSTRAGGVWGAPVQVTTGALHVALLHVP